MYRSLLWTTTLALLTTAAAPLDREAISPSTAQTTVALRLNVPAYRLDLLENGDVRESYLVAVGEPRYPTPLGQFMLTHITWNPWWRPPKSEWARDDTVQRPGPTNPMGRVKLQFGTLYFLHGTPNENSIGKAASHGCVRMRDSDVRPLARALNRVAGGGLSETALDTIESDWSRTVTVELLEPVPIDVVYSTVEIDASRLYLHRDIYARDRPSEVRALVALVGAGHDTARVDRALLTTLVRRARVRSTSVAIDTLLGTMPIVAQSHADAGSREVNLVDAPSPFAPACERR